MKLKDVLSEDIRQQGVFGAPTKDVRSFADRDPSRPQYDGEDDLGNPIIKTRPIKMTSDDELKARVPDSIRAIADQMGFYVIGNGWASGRSDLVEPSKVFASKIAEVGELVADETDVFGRHKQTFQLPDGEVMIYNTGNRYEYPDKTRKEATFDYMNFVWKKK